jgi:adenine-specific DNA-methyltransferase
MVDESLKDHIRTHFPDRGKDFEVKLGLLLSYGRDHSFLSDEIDALLGILNSCRIFDPACGSGAFPMGILQRMVFLLHKLDPDNENWKQQQIERVTKETQKAYQNGDSKVRDQKLDQIRESFDESTNFPDYARKLYLIENSIYGSDIQPIAIQICKLRFFISLVIEQKKRNDLDNFGIRALPNLETKFVCANSLVQLDKRVSDLLIQEKGLFAMEEELKVIRHSHFAPQNRKQKLDLQKKDKDIRDRMAELIQMTVEQKNIGIDQQIKDLENRHVHEPLKRNDVTKLKRLKVNLENKLDGVETSRLLTEWKPYDSNGTAPFFDLEWMFGLEEGFDIIIGNPPYVQLQKDSGKLADLYADKDFETFVRSGDIYCLFYERGINLINEKGNLCYITSNKWMKAKYGEKMRAFFLKQGNVKTLIDFGDAHLFENATTYTNILLYKKKKSSTPNTIVDLSGKVDLAGTVYDLLDKVESGVSDFSSSRFLINNQSDAFLKKRIEERGVPLKNWDINIYRGITTGFNEAFIIDLETRDRLIAENPKNKEIIKPLLRGRDIKRYQVDWQDLWLIDTHNGYSTETKKIAPIDIQQYPGIKTNLDQYKKELVKRYDKGSTPYNLRNCAYHEEFKKEKLIYSELTQNASFYFNSEGDYFVPNTAYILTGVDIKYLCAFLNSKLITYAFRRFYTQEMQGGTLRYLAQYIAHLPIPQISKEDQEPFNELLDYIQFAHKHQVMDPTGSREVATYFEEVMDLLAAGILFKKELQKAECFINNDLLALLPSLSAFPDVDEKIEHVSQTYKSLSTEPLIESSRMRYKLIDVLKPVFGEGYK